MGITCATSQQARIHASNEASRSSNIPKRLRDSQSPILRHIRRRIKRAGSKSECGPAHRAAQSVMTFAAVSCPQVQQPGQRLHLRGYVTLVNRQRRRAWRRHRREWTHAQTGGMRFGDTGARCSYLGMHSRAAPILEAGRWRCRLRHRMRRLAVQSLLHGRVHTVRRGSRLLPGALTHIGNGRHPIHCLRPFLHRMPIDCGSRALDLATGTHDTAGKCVILQAPPWCPRLHRQQAAHFYITGGMTPALRPRRRFGQAAAFAASSAAPRNGAEPG